MKKGKMTALKAIMLFFLISFLCSGGIIGAQFYLLPNIIIPNSMQGLDPYGHDNNAGNKVVAYNANTKEFTNRYVPSSLLAMSKSSVGYVLVFESDAELRKEIILPKNGIARSNGIASVEILKVSLRNYKTGTVIATQTFMGQGSTVEISRVESWVTEQLQK